MNCERCSLEDIKENETNYECTMCGDVKLKHEKEIIYDKEISHHIKEITRVCKDKNIEFFIDVSIGDNQVDSCVTSKANGVFKYVIYRAIQRLTTREGVNIDGFLFWLYKNFKNKSSVFLDKLFKNGEWRD